MLRVITSNFPDKITNLQPLPSLVAERIEDELAVGLQQWRVFELPGRCGHR
jgi:hypothetical protein